jgi:hypothetical protein
VKKADTNDGESQIEIKRVVLEMLVEEIREDGVGYDEGENVNSK